MLERMVGPHIRTARKEAGITQRALAEMLGIAAPFLLQIEKGRRPVPDWVFKKLPPEIRRQAIRATIAELSTML